MKQRIGFFILIPILVGLLAACNQQAGTVSEGGQATSAQAATSTPASAPSTPESVRATIANTNVPAATVASTTGDGETIRVYSSLPHQSARKGEVDAVINAIKMRLGEDENQVCSGQFKIDYVDLDDSTAAAGMWDAATEEANAKKAIDDSDAMIYIGPFNSAAAKISIPILNQANMVMISPSNTYIGLTKKTAVAGEPDIYYPTKTRNYTRVVTADDVQGDAAAKWAQKLGIKKVYILDDQQVYGKGVASVFEKSAQGLGLEVLGHDSIDPKAQDYRTLMTKIQSLSPDLVYFGGVLENNAGQVLKDMRAVGMTPDKVRFMGPDGILNSAFIDVAGAKVAEGVYATITGLPLDRLGQKGKDFYKKYKDKYHVEAESYGIYGYEAASVALTVLNKVCKKDRAAIRDAVFAIKDFDGVLGKWSFDANGDTTLADIQGFLVRGGAFEPVNLFTDGKWEK
jgi:branched-chain amino acid transport system substrate-binding protein